MSDTFTGETYNTLCKDAEDYLSKGSPEQARELLQKAVSLIGTRPAARSLLADTCMTMELWSEARDQLEILITLDEGNTGNHFKLAQVLEELGEYQLAADNYRVVLDGKPDHHGAKVALKRIASRDRDSGMGVNLADVFRSHSEEPEEGPAEDEQAGEAEDQGFREGMQIYPDVPSDDIFAESEDEEEDDSVDALLKNIGLTGASVSDNDDEDVSRLLENIGVSTSTTLASAFAEAGETGQEDSDGGDESTVAEKKKVVSLDDIFGTSAREEEPAAAEAGEEAAVHVPAEEEEPVAAEAGEEAVVHVPAEEEEPAAAEAGEEAVVQAHAGGVAEEEEVEEEVEEEIEESAPGSGAGKTLEDMFSASAGEQEEEETSSVEAGPAEPEEVAAAEPEIEEAAASSVEEVLAEPEEAAAEPGIEEIAASSVEEVLAEPEEAAAEPEIEEVAASSVEEVLAEPEEAAAEPGIEEPSAGGFLLLRNDAEYTMDTWSPESGLLTVNMASGTLDMEASRLTVVEKTLEMKLLDEGTFRLSGQGTFLINCGREAPLRLNLRDDMIIRRDLVILHTGEITLELLDVPGNEDFYVVKNTAHESVVLRADDPVRVILLGQNRRVFLVRTSAIAAADPDIVFSGSKEGYTEVSGSGKLYLIE
ncbi:MAG: hypothetical protein AVO35_00845 [Candidatus Aegiribacteria sp. MLS_C]|nr:MAG: hypothetical protein AVO35_00845 [Candidatus Aegiribacteria sp. MLS_C]